MTGTARRRIYINPTAADWKLQAPTKSNVEIREFHASFRDYEVTRLFSLPAVARELGIKRVLVKDETSRLGLPSFKILGASWALHQALVEKDISRPGDFADGVEAVKGNPITIVAATDGNHGRAVAKVCWMLGDLKVKIFVPKGLDQATKDRISDEGAAVIVVAGDYDDAVKAAFEDSKNGSILIQDTSFEGYTKIPQMIVDGYSTLFHEISDQLDGEAPDVVVVPAGVGSLTQATVTYSKSNTPTSAVLAVEPDTAACLYKSLRTGKPNPIKTYNTIMTGMNCGTVSDIAWPTLKPGVDVCATISDFEAHLAVQELSEAGVPAGPCGGAALAALRHVSKVGPQSLRLGPDSTVVLIATEGHRDYETPSDVRSDDPAAIQQALARIGTSKARNPGQSRTNDVDTAEFIAAWLEHRDIEVDWVENVPGNTSVTGHMRGSEEKRLLMSDGHVDIEALVKYSST